jgi:exodeoxyribonuclease VII large subunit
VTVDELTNLVKAAISSAPELRNAAVRGELQNFKRHVSGHVYFTLVGKESRISGVLFRSHAGSVIDWPEDGDEVIVTGGVDVYPKGGAYQIYATRILPIGLGAQTRAREELRAALEREGLFDVRHKRPFPIYPAKVAVVTSPTGAALHDILKVSAKRAPFIDIVIIPATVQGVDAPPQVTRALALCGRLSGVECLILARGGGAKDDLSPFDDERVVRAIRNCPLPVATGIGHQTDRSLADLAADAALPTPSAAAEMVFPDASAIRARLSQIGGTLAGGALNICENLEGALDRREERLARLMCAGVDADEKFVGAAMRELSIRAVGAVERGESLLASRAAALDALSPLSVLGRGYAICRDASGATLRSASAIEPGDVLNIRFRDGEADATVSDVRKRPFREGGPI